jgi:signal transduction histidine kinase
MLGWKGIIIVIAIAAMSVTLSVISYHSAQITSNEIVKIAGEQVKSNADTQAYDLSRIVSAKVRSIYENLQILANGPEVQKGEYQNPFSLFSAAQDSTKDLTDYYMWINKNGTIVLSSNMIQTTYEHHFVDQSSEPIFTEPMLNHATYFSNLTATPAGIQKLYISYPIFYSRNDNASEVGKFEGVVVGSINLDTLGTLLRNELVPGLKTEGLALVDTNGKIIYDTDRSLIGNDAFADESKSIFPSHSSLPEDIGQINGVVRGSLGSAGSDDILLDKTTYTIAYRPITHDGKLLWTLFVLVPHDFADSVDSLVDEQNTFGILLIVIIGAITIGAAYIVLIWNKRLAKTVEVRTSELKSSKDLLEKANADLSRSYVQLRTHSAMQQEFINIAAHELRTPITPILGMTDMMESAFKNKSEIVLGRNEFDIISRNARRLERLSIDILDTTRIESHALVLKKEPFNLNDVISIAVKDAEYQLTSTNKSSNVQLLYQPSDIIIMADKTRVTQVVLVLFSNALKFTTEGTIRIRCEATPDGFVVVSVKDTGTGIDSRILPRLFTKFATVSHIDGPQIGIGLGLYIAKSMVDAHGGRIWAENNRDEKGSTFSFSLPLYNDVAKED